MLNLAVDVDVHVVEDDAGGCLSTPGSEMYGPLVYGLWSIVYGRLGCWAVGLFDCYATGLLAKCAKR
ncbi:uncharacterized protein Dyak_GE28850 [Drosophila yakuba]|uniref:Uncharacterized protein n=1 Tax=Drosophila yakuba TaxID=7245 RepID=A0A0R1DRX1_DROYA|nr:uncharacterized protein Dyak_GE28850 [Drosophila yakuba]